MMDIERASLLNIVYELSYLLVFSSCIKGVCPIMEYYILISLAEL